MSCSICGEAEDFIMTCKVCGKDFCEFCGDAERRICSKCLAKMRHESKAVLV